MYTVKHAAALTGIRPDTLRMWERRYGVVTPSRSAGGYRLYDDAAVARLSAMRALVEAGWSPRRAALQVASGTTLGRHDRPTDDQADPGTVRPEQTDDVDVLRRLASEFDTTGLARVLDAKFADGDLEALADAWLMPALYDLGEGWLQGEVSVAAEHAVTSSVQRRLAAALDAAAPAPGAPSVLVGLARASRHELGVLTFAVLLARAGLDVVYLGGDLPPDSWVVAVRAREPAAVVLGVPRQEDAPLVRDTATAVMAARPGMPLLLGGAFQYRVGVGEPLGHSIAGAARTLSKRLAAGALATTPAGECNAFALQASRIRKKR